MSDDAPIEPFDFIYGLKVIDIGDLRIARGLARRPHSACRHLHLVYDQKERRIYCTDCETDVHPFDAFVGLAERSAGYRDHLNAREERVKEAETFAVRSRAAKAMDDVWRSRTMIPCCPHCRRGIAPEDVANGISQVGREYEAARRAAEMKDHK